MNITSSAISLNVADPTASAEILGRHFGFNEDMSDDGFLSLSRPDAAVNIIYLRVGLPTFKPESAAGPANGLLVVFTVDDIDTEYERLRKEGVEMTTPIETEAWGERYFQATDPNGVVIQLVQWVEAPPAEVKR
jgi:uncharacterized glyoxalase superfamily protein PhnB